MFKFFASKSECFTKYDALCSYIFDYACLGRKAYQKGSKLWKNYIHEKTCLKMVGGGRGVASGIFRGGPNYNRPSTSKHDLLRPNALGPCCLPVRDGAKEGGGGLIITLILIKCRHAAVDILCCCMFFGSVAGMNVGGSHNCMLQRTRFCGISFFLHLFFFYKSRE